MDTKTTDFEGQYLPEIFGNISTLKIFHDLFLPLGIRNCPYFYWDRFFSCLVWDNFSLNLLKVRRGLGVILILKVDNIFTTAFMILFTRIYNCKQRNSQLAYQSDVIIEMCYKKLCIQILTNQTMWVVVLVQMITL